MYLSIITLTINGLNAAIKRHRLTEHRNKTRIQAVYKRPASDLRRQYRLKGRGWKKVLHVNGNQRKVGLAILILHKVDFKIKLQNIEKDIT